METGTIKAVHIVNGRIYAEYADGDYEWLYEATFDETGVWVASDSRGHMVPSQDCRAHMGERKDNKDTRVVYGGR